MRLPSCSKWDRCKNLAKLQGIFFERMEHLRPLHCEIKGKDSVRLLVLWDGRNQSRSE